MKLPEDIPCPHCGAGAGSICKASSGRPVSAHKARCLGVGWLPRPPDYAAYKAEITKRAVARFKAQEAQMKALLPDRGR